MKKLIAGLSLLLIASTVLCAAPKKAKKTKKAKRNIYLIKFKTILTPDKLVKNSKIRCSNRQMSKNINIYYFTLLGCKVDYFTPFNICFEEKLPSRGGNF